MNGIYCDENFPRKNKIKKLIYRIEHFDVCRLRPGERTVITLYADGTVVYKEYNPGCKKAYLTEKERCSKQAFEELCARIEECIDTADRWDFCVDDASEELKIVYDFGRTQTVDRGLGNAQTRIGKIMNNFLDSL